MFRAVLPIEQRDEFLQYFVFARERRIVGGDAGIALEHLEHERVAEQFGLLSGDFDDGLVDGLAGIVFRAEFLFARDVFEQGNVLS